MEAGVHGEFMVGVVQLVVCWEHKLDHVHAIVQQVQMVENLVQEMLHQVQVVLLILVQVNIFVSCSTRIVFCY